MCSTVSPISIEWVLGVVMNRTRLDLSRVVDPISIATFGTQRCHIVGCGATSAVEVESSVRKEQLC